MAHEPTTRDRLARLHTALLADCMDQLGFRDSALGPAIRPMMPGQTLVGTAFTMRCAAITESKHEPYQHLLGAFASMGDGDVIVMRCADGVSAMWGELLSAAAQVKGAVGAVMDGVTRDVDQIAEIGFPVFCEGFSPLDSAGRQEVVEHGVAVDCGMAVVNPGDWIVGDVMGVVVIPQAMVEDVIEQAEAKDQGEATVLEEILRGDEIGDVFARHGIL